MAGEIFIADKPTLDNVKQDTEFIRNNFLINDWSRYNIINKFENILDTSDYKTLLDVKGEGYITCVLLKSKYGSLKITIDDDIFYDSTRSIDVGANRSAIMGISNISILKFFYKPGELELSGFYGLPYLNVDSSKGATCIIEIPIFFKKSFKIEYKCRAGGFGAYAVVLGGVK